MKPPRVNLIALQTAVLFFAIGAGLNCCLFFVWCVFSILSFQQSGDALPPLWELLMAGVICLFPGIFLSFGSIGVWFLLGRQE